MNNPFYILQLSDWHLKISKEEEVEKYLSSVEKSLKTFLESRGRDCVNIVAITGDMMDKNGLIKDESNKVISDDDHSIVSQAIDRLKPIIYKEGKTKIYVSPGNHDCDSDQISALLKEEVNKSILDTIGLPNYSVVDKNHEGLRKAFFKFKNFADAIKADNRDNPFHGFDSFKVGEAELFISWFNSSWLCMRDWSDFKSKSNYDEQNLSVGYEINKTVLNNFDKWKNDNSSKNRFSLSMFHHYPRSLSWHDKYDVTGSNFTRNDGVVVDCTEHKCVYANHFNHYNLVLNGHTHGKLFDPPYHTGYGGMTMESAVSENKLTIFEVDLYRSLFIAHDIPLNGETDSVVRKRVMIYNHDKFNREIKSNYENTDLYNDLKYNLLLKGAPSSKTFQDSSESDGIFLLKDLVVAPNIGIVLDKFKWDQEKFPFVYEDIESEIEASNIKLNTLKRHITKQSD